MQIDPLPCEPHEPESDCPIVPVLLQCPRCRTHLGRSVCGQCGFRLETNKGIVDSLPAERKTYYARFIRDYEHIRAAEGRGSNHPSYYLSLPYKDITGRNQHQWSIRSRSYDFLVQQVLKPLNCRGVILDLGAGNCWMSFRLALAGFIPVAVDLLTNEHDGLGAAIHFDTSLSAPFPRFHAEASHLPFRDEQFDAIVFNASFHYSEDYEITLREVLRCLKRGGLVIICDTPLYSREESGREMVAERRSAFLQRFGTASDSLKSIEYLTAKRLRNLEKAFSIRWIIHRPWYGWKWALRPWIAWIRGKREPSRFYIYSARKPV